MLDYVKFEIYMPTWVLNFVVQTYWPTVFVFIVESILIKMQISKYGIKIENGYKV
jgi:hypothetical protein